MSETNSEGFAQPWVDFEKQIGQRIKFTGPTADDLWKQSATHAELLISKLTFPSRDRSVETIDKEIAPGLKVRIYTPPNYPGDRPVGLFYHGGGWVLGDLEGEDHQIRTMCKDAGVVIVSVDYRRAPAHPYPAPLDDCVTAYQWALKNADSLKTTPNRAFTSGTSAGGNLALSAALRVIDVGLRETLVGVLAIIPITIDPAVVPEKWKSRYTSYEEHAEHTINTKAGMKTFYEAYNGDGNDPYVSPLLYTRLAELPRVYLASCGLDTLRDDARLLKSALEEARVPLLFDEYLGYPHAFWMFPSEHLAAPIAQYSANVAKGIAFVLSEKSKI